MAPTRGGRERQGRCWGQRGVLDIWGTIQDLKEVVNHQGGVWPRNGYREVKALIKTLSPETSIERS